MYSSSAQEWVILLLKSFYQFGSRFDNCKRLDCDRNWIEKLNIFQYLMSERGNAFFLLSNFKPVLTESLFQRLFNINFNENLETRASIIKIYDGSLHFGLKSLRIYLW